MRPRQKSARAAARYGEVPMFSPFYQFGKSRKRVLAESFGNAVKMRIASLVHVAALLIAVAGIPVLAQQNSGYLKTKVDPGRAGVFIDGKYVGPAGKFRHRQEIHGRGRRARGQAI